MPRAILFENVAVFGQKRGRRHRARLRSELSVGYDLYPHVYNCADYGMAQSRQRFVMVGIRKDQGVAFRIPPPLDLKVTVGRVLGGLPEPPVDCSVHPEIPNHQRARVSALNVERFSYVPQGGGWRDIPPDLRLPCHRRADGASGGWPDVYGRLEWDGQCPTITGGFDSFSRGRFGHPLVDRPLTAREAARLQGFDDDFEFLGTRVDWRRQIGNVVPPPLARAIGREVLASLALSESPEASDVRGGAPA